MSMVTKELLEQLGYDSEDIASILFKEYVDYIAEEIKVHGIDETMKLVEDEESSLYVELTHFILEIGMKTFRSTLERYHEERDMSKIDIRKYLDVYKEVHPKTYQISAFLIANYLVKQKKDDKKDTKKLNKN